MLLSVQMAMLDHPTASKIALLTTAYSQNRLAEIACYCFDRLMRDCTSQS